MAEFDNHEKQEIFSKKVRAGKRTYFFDVRTTRSEDYYLTITESKKRFPDGSFEKHKIFLYKEDFDNFLENLQETLAFIKDKSPAFDSNGNLDESLHIANRPRPEEGEEVENASNNKVASIMDKEEEDESVEY